MPVLIFEGKARSLSMQTFDFKCKQRTNNPVQFAQAQITKKRVLEL
jgi:hypothetical protein